MPKSTSLLVAANDVGANDKLQGGNQANGVQKSISSMISFSSSIEEVGEPARPYEFLGHKVEVVYSLLTMLSSHDRLESSQTFLAMSQELESSQLMRQSGCMALLIQLLHNGDITCSTPTGEDLEVINRASQALRNLVRFQTDETRQRRELKILRPLEQIRAYVLHLRVHRVGINQQSSLRTLSTPAQDIAPAVALLMKFSFDEEDRYATFQLGGLQAIAETLIIDQHVFGVSCSPSSLILRRYIGMTLTNLTFGAAQNKQILCSYPKFLDTLNCQIESLVEDIRSVFASVLRNLSWKADISSKIALRNVSTCTVLIKAAMQAEKEATLKSVLSALWNLSAHCSENKIEICNVAGALEFLVSTLSYDCVSSSQGTAIVENGGGILRNISSHIAAREEYRDVLRRNNCFQILLRHLQSSSLTIVSNSCGTLWNLSAHNVQDQKTLWEMGAVTMLANLVHSKHKMISLGSSATLKNLLEGKPPSSSSNNSRASSVKDEFGGVLMKARKYRTLECEIDENLSGVCGGFGKNASSGTGNINRDCYSFLSMKQQNSSKMNPIAMNYMPNMTVAPASHGAGFNYCQMQPPPTDVMKSSSISSCSSAAMQRSKIEQVQQDRSITQRFHNSLRRSQRKEMTGCCNNDDGDEEVVRSYCVEDSCPPGVRFNDTLTGSAPHNFKTSYDELEMQQENVKSYAVEGTPAQMSHGSSLSDLRNAIDKGETALKQDFVNMINKTSMTGGMMGRDKSQSATSSQRDSKLGTATMPTPMMYSRHSSLQSLESCEQQSVRSTVYSEHSQQPTGLHSPSELPDSPTQSIPQTPNPEKSLGIREDPVGIESAQLDYQPVIESALPKPKFKSNFKLKSAAQNAEDLANYVSSQQHRGKNVAIAKPMVRDAAPVAETVPPPAAVPVAFAAVPTFYKSDLVQDEEQEDLRVYATEPTPGTSLRSSFNNLYVKSTFKDEDPSRKMRGSPYAALSKQSPAAQSPKISHSFDYSEITADATQTLVDLPGVNKCERTDVEECIYSALPKPKNRKSKSLDRKSQQRIVAAAASSGCSKMTGTDANRSSDLGIGAKDRKECSPETHRGHKVSPQANASSADVEKGILEMSDISLVDSIDVQTDCPSNTNDTLHLSSCSNFVQTTSTCEKVKDAASLFSRVSSTPKKSDAPVSTMAFYSPPPPLHINAADNGAAAAIAGKSSSDETNESLSEDNYSRIEDEQFDIAPDDIDIDIDLLSPHDESPLNATVIHCKTDLADEILSSQEFLLDCGKVAQSLHAAVASDANMQRNLPKILKEPPPTDIMEAKKVHGMKKVVSKQSEQVLNAAFAAPKLAVRTTKTAELRAKKVNETTERLRTLSGGSRSASPSTPRKWASSPRTSDAELDCSKFSRNTFERRSRQSTSSGEMNMSPNNVSSWPRALSNFNFIEKSSNNVKNLPVPFLKVDSVPNSTQKSKPAVPPKPTRLGRQSPGLNPDDVTHGPIVVKKSIGKQVGSKIASLWKKDELYSAEGSADSQAFDEGNLTTGHSRAMNLKKLSHMSSDDRLQNDSKHSDPNGPASCLVQPFSYIPKSPKGRTVANKEPSSNAEPSKLLHRPNRSSTNATMQEAKSIDKVSKNKEEFAQNTTKEGEIVDSNKSGSSKRLLVTTV